MQGHELLSQLPAARSAGFRSALFSFAGLALLSISTTYVADVLTRTSRKLKPTASNIVELLTASFFASILCGGAVYSINPEPYAFTVAASTLSFIISIMISCSVAFRPIRRHRQNDAVELTAWRHWFDGEGHLKLFHCLRISGFRKNIRLGMSAGPLNELVIGNYRFIDFESDPSLVKLNVASNFAVSLTTAVLTSIFLNYIIKWLTPVSGLIATCFVSSTSTSSELGSQTGGFGMARWRNPVHAPLFNLARVIERCIPRLQKRLSADDFQMVAVAYLDLANHLREQAVRPTGHAPSRLDVLYTMSATLAVNDDIIRSARRISHIVPSKHSQYVKYSLASRWLSAINAALENNNKAIGLFLVVIVIAYQLSYGGFDHLVEFLKSLSHL